MTTMIENQGRTARRRRLARVMLETVSSAASAIREWGAARRLSRLDDTALKDLCVSRGNIAWVVRQTEGSQDNEGPC